MTVEERTNAKGSSTVTITSDDNGRMGVTCYGNLTMAEVILGMKLLEKSLLEKATSSGVLQPGRIDGPLRVKRF